MLRIRHLFNGNLRLAIMMMAASLISACSIEGKVTLDGEPLAGVTVHLQGEGLNLTTQTDNRGRYAFDQIDSGFYHVSLEQQGMTLQRVDKPTNNGSVKNVNFVISSKTLRHTQQGPVLGSTDDNGTLVWKGIPYASAPVNKLRWKAARPASQRSGDYWALNFSDPCPQLAHLQIDFPITMLGDTVGREDCLYLNVWTPDFDTIPRGTDSRPVMFWIHGGGNTAGEAAIFTGKALAERYGVIVVSVNYRLGILGYFSHPALRDNAELPLDESANFAITDLIQALQWVQDNITAFGGDPNRVMIFGESAGAFNVGALLASPQAAGLFQRAAMQSGGFGWSTRAESENFQAEGGSAFSSREMISKFLVADGSAADAAQADILQADMSPAEIRDYLYSKTPQQLLAHFDGSGFGMYSHPEVIRDDIVIPDEEPYELFRSGNYHQVPLITGTNRDESKIFMAFNPEFVPGGLPIFIKNPVYYNLTAYYQSSLWRARAVDEFAMALSGQATNLFAYRFDWDEEPRILFNDVSETIGAAHFFEIPFVFNTPDTFTVQLASPLLFTPSFAEGRKILAQSMSSYWAAFAYHGDPGSGFNDSEALRWESWSDNSNDDHIILFDSVNDRGIRMASDRISFDGIQQELQQETGFNRQEEKCTVYLRTFGADDWFDSQCDPGM